MADWKAVTSGILLVELLGRAVEGEGKSSWKDDMGMLGEFLRFAFLGEKQEQ